MSENKAENDDGALPPDEAPSVASRDPSGGLAAAYLTLGDLSKHFPSGRFESKQVAAARIGKRPSTINPQIKKLETFHSLTILAEDSVTKEWFFTTFGRQLALRAQLLLERMIAVETFSLEASATLRVGAANAIFQYILPSYLQPSRKINYSMELIDTPWEQRLRQVISGDLDVAFGLMISGKLPDEVSSVLDSYRFSNQYEMIAVASNVLAPDFGAKNMKYPSFVEAVGEYPIIFTQHDRANLEQAGLRTNPRIVCPSLGIAMEHVVRGLGVGILWNYELVAQHPGIALREFVQLPAPEMQIVMYWRKDNYEQRENIDKDPLVAFVKELKEKEEEKLKEKRSASTVNPKSKTSSPN